MRIAAAALLVLLLCAAGAGADADPASDVLLGASVFYPYSPPVSPPVESRLNAEVAAAARAHFPLKVALIGSPVDLGAIPALYGKPKQYASFLDQEISFSAKVPLLVVMPAGVGVAGLDPPATAAGSSLGKPAGTGSDALALAALAAVPRLAAAAGHPVASVGSTTRSGGGGSALVPVLIVVVVAVAVSGAVIAFKRRAPAGRRRR